MSNTRIIYFDDVLVAAPNTARVGHNFNPTLDGSGNSDFFTPSAYLRVNVGQTLLFPNGIAYTTQLTSSGAISGVSASGISVVSASHIVTQLSYSGCYWGGINASDTILDVDYTIDSSLNQGVVRINPLSMLETFGGNQRSTFGHHIMGVAANAIRSLKPGNLEAVFQNSDNAATTINNACAVAIANMLATNTSQDKILQNYIKYNGSKDVINPSGGIMNISGGERFTFAFRLRNIDVNVTMAGNITRMLRLKEIPVFMTFTDYFVNRPLATVDFSNTDSNGFTWVDAAPTVAGIGAGGLTLAGKARTNMWVYDPQIRQVHEIPDNATVFANMDASNNIQRIYRVLNQGTMTITPVTYLRTEQFDDGSYPDVEVMSDGSIVIAFYYKNLSSASSRCRLLDIRNGKVISEYPMTTASGAVAFTVISPSGVKVKDRVIFNIGGQITTNVPAGLYAGIVANNNRNAIYACLSCTRNSTISGSGGPAIAKIPASVTAENDMRLLVKFDMNLDVQWSLIMHPFIMNPTPTADGGVYLGTRFNPSNGKGDIFDVNGNIVSTLPSISGTLKEANHIVRIGPSGNVIWNARFGYDTATGAISHLEDVESTEDGGVVAVHKSTPNVQYRVISSSGVVTMPTLPSITTGGHEFLSLHKFTPSGALQWTAFQYAAGISGVVQSGSVSESFDAMSRRYTISMSDGGFAFTSFTHSIYPAGENINGHNMTIFRSANGTENKIPNLYSFERELDASNNVYYGITTHLTKYDASGNLKWASLVYPSDGTLTMPDVGTGFYIAEEPNGTIVALNAYRGFKIIDANNRYMEHGPQDGQIFRMTPSGALITPIGAYYSLANAAASDDGVVVSSGGHTYLYALPAPGTSQAINVPYNADMSIYVPPYTNVTLMDVNSIAVPEKGMIEGPAMFPASKSEQVPSTVRKLRIDSLIPNIF